MSAAGTFWAKLEPYFYLVLSSNLSSRQAHSGLGQLQAGDPYDARLRACLRALRDNARIRGDEEEAEHWATELLAARGRRRSLASPCGTPPPWWTGDEGRSPGDGGRYRTFVTLPEDAASPVGPGLAKRRRMDLELRGRHGDLLHEVVAQGWAQLRSRMGEAGTALPRHVEDEVEGYLNCGDPARGFAWLECEGCASHRSSPSRARGGASARRARGAGWRRAPCGGPSSFHRFAYGNSC